MNKQLAHRIVSAFTIIMVVLSVLPAPQVSAHPALPQQNNSIRNTAVIQPSSWTSQYASANYPSASGGTITIPAGANRLLVVAIASTATAAGSQTVSTITYGGQALSLAAGDGGSTVTWNHSYLYYLNEAGIEAASGNALSVTISGGTSYYTWIYSAVFDGVDQTTPITDSKNYNSATADSAVGPFNPTLTIAANDQAVEIVNLARSSSGSNARSISTWEAGWDTAGVQPAAITTNGPTAQLYIRNRNILTAAGDGSQQTADSSNTWDSMTAMSIHPYVSPNTTTVGNGASEPANVTIGPGGVATALDAFTLQASAGTDMVTGATVTLAPASAWTNIGTVAITPDGGGTPFCSATPSSNTVTLTGCNLSVSTSSIQYNVWITPLSASGMPGVASGASYATNGTITSITSINSGIYNDSTSATVTVDNLSPANPTGLTGTPGNNQVVLNWTNPADTDLSQLVMIRRAGSAVGSTQPTEGSTYSIGNAISTGTVVCVVNSPTPGGPGTCTDSGLTNGTNYYYKIFAADGYKNYSNGGMASPTFYTPFHNVTIVGLPTAAASAGSATSVTVSMPYTDDSNGNNTYTVDYCLTSEACASNGSWSHPAALSGVHSSSPFTGTISGLTPSVSYDFRFWYNDPDGVSGYNPQVVTGVFTNGSTTVGDNTIAEPPSPVTIGPGGAATPLDAFSLATSTGTDTVTGATVTLAGDASAYTNIATLAIKSDDDTTTTYCSATPSSDTVALTGCAIPVTSSPVEYKVVITPKTAAAMPAVPGAAYPTTGLVTAISSANAPIYNDATSATVTIDNASPANPTGLTGTPGNTQVVLNWTNPADADLTTLVVLRRSGSAVGSTQPTEGNSYSVGNTISSGTVACVVTGANATPSAPGTCTDTGLTNGTNYYYKIFAADAFNNYSSGGTASPTFYTPAFTNATAAGTATAVATAGSTSSITVSMPYAGDLNGDNTYTVNYCLTSANCPVSTLWTNWVTAAAHVASPYSTAITGLSGSTSYDVQVIYNDADGVSGNQTQTITGVLTNHLTTLGDNTSGEPVNATIGPAPAPIGPVTALDNFTLVTDTGTDTVTAATVTLGPASAYTNIRTIAITSDDGTTTSYCSATPASNTVNLTSCSIPVTTTPTEFKVMVTPRNATGSTGSGGMPAIPGASFATTGTITAFSSSTAHAGTDATSATVTIDNLSPGVPTALSVTPGDTTMAVSWTNPVDADLSTLLVFRRAGSATSNTQPTEGTTYSVGATLGSNTLACVVTAPAHACTDTGLVNGTNYYYRIFAMDSHDNYSNGSLAGGAFVFAKTPTTAGTVSASATSGSTTSITVTIPYTDDTNGSNTYTVQYCLTSANCPVSGSWIFATGGNPLAHATTSPASLAIGSLTAATSYDIKVTYNDLDGVTGTNPQTVTGVVTNSTTTLGDGTNPSNSSTGQGGAAAQLDAFTLATAAGTDTVTGLTVTLAGSNVWRNIATVAIKSDDGVTTTYCSATPASNTVALTVCGIPVSNVSTQFKVVITPNLAAAMPAIPGNAYATTGTVTAFTSHNVHAGTDAASATVTVDNASPSNPSAFTATPGDAQIVLSWTNPADTDLSQLVVVRRAGSATDTTQPTEGNFYNVGDALGTGTVACVVSSAVPSATGVTCTDTNNGAGLSDGTAYYYRIFANDAYLNYSSAGVAIGPFSPYVSANNATITGTATAAAVSGSAASILVTMPYTGDQNADNTYTVDYCLTSAACTIGGGGWTNWVTGAAHHATPYTTTINSGLLDNTSYDIQVTYSDTGVAGDGVTGSNPQVITGVTTNGTTTLGDHTTAEPGNVTIGQGGLATPLDAFTLATDGNADTVTGLTVSLAPASAYTNIATLAVTSDDGVTTSYCSATPASNTVALTGCGIPVTSSSTEFMVLITPKTGPNMPGVSTGADYATTGSVTALTSSTNGHTGTDASSATITVDNASPANPTAFSAAPGDTQVVLNWTNPANPVNASLNQLVVLRRLNQLPDLTQPTEGTLYSVGQSIGTSTVVCVVTSPVPSAAGTCTDTAVANWSHYYYRIFAMDGFANYSNGGIASGLVTPYPVGNNQTTAGTATAVAVNETTDSIAVSMPYSFDFNTNNTYTVDYCLTSANCTIGGSWTSNWVTAAAHSLSPYTTTITGLAEETSYDIRVTYNDADGFTNPSAQTQVITGVTTNGITTIGSGTDPAAPVTLGPDGLITPLDAFTLSTDVGNDTVTGATVTLAPAGAFNNVGALALTSTDGLTTYCATAGAPASNTIALTGCTFPTVNTVPASFMVEVTPKSSAAMPAVPGAAYATTGTVTALVNLNFDTASDTAGPAVTIDNQSPANPTAFSGIAADTQVTLNWTNPADADLSQLVVVRHASSATASTQPTEGNTAYAVSDTIGTGTVACVVTTPTPGAAGTCTDTGLTDGTAYYYRIFAMDTFGNFSNGGITAGPITPTADVTTAGTATAVSASPTSITVSMPYTNDVNINNSYTVDYCLTAAACQLNGSWTNNWVSGAAHVASPYTTTITGLALSASYDVRVTYVDPDGVTGTNPQVIRNVSAASIPAGSYSWTAPLNINSVTVQVWGGGGAGGNLTTTGVTGGGGGGAYSKATFAVTPGNTYTVVIGAGATPGGGSPAAGGDSWFTDGITNFVLAKGGSSVPDGTNAGGAGGQSGDGIGDVVYSGGAGFTSSGSTSGGGGSSAGTAADGTSATSRTGATAPTGGGNGGSGGRNSGNAGSPGSVPGGGGGGTYDNTQTAATGGAGAAGKFLIQNFWTNDTTTVGTGTDPVSNVTIGPGGAATWLDGFTLNTSSGTDGVTGLTVTLSPTGAYNNIAALAVKSADGLTSYCSATVSSDAVSLSSCAIPVDTNLAAYNIWITPKTAGNMPAVPGASYPTAGTVTAITATDLPVYNDTDTTTVTIDNLSPGLPTAFYGVAGDTTVTLNWTSPADLDVGQYLVLRNTSSSFCVYNQYGCIVPTEGATYVVGNTITATILFFSVTATVACVVNAPATTCTDTGLANGTNYYYRVYAVDGYKNYSNGGAAAGPIAPYSASLNATSAGAATASGAGLAGAIKVTMPYTNDLNHNNTYTVEYCLHSDNCPGNPDQLGAPLWTILPTAANTSSPYTTTITGLAIPSSWDILVKYNDADGVGGINPQTILNVTTNGYLNVGDGTDPASNVTIGPGSPATELEAFTLFNDTGTDAVTGLTVSLAPSGAYNNIATLAITNDGGATTYCSTSPSSDSVALTGCNIPVDTNPTQYNVWITPKSAAGMPAVPGAAYATTGTVTAVTATNGALISDSDVPTVTIDNLSPANPSSFAGTPGDTQIVLNWTNPADTDLSQVVVVRRSGQAVSSTQPTEGTTYFVGGALGSSGTVACVVTSPTPGGPGTCTDTGLTNGTDYYYRIFAMDAYQNYSSGGSTAGPLTPVPGATSAGTVTAAASSSSATAITVTVPYSGDGDGDSTYTVDYCLSADICPVIGAGWTNWIDGTLTNNHSVSPYTVPITGLSLFTSYDVRVTYNDPDGVNGENPQVIRDVETMLPPGPSTWTAPTGAYSVTVQAWGGGGAGGNTTNSGGAGGGGGGAYSTATFPVYAGNIYDITVGAGGTPGASPVDGGDSSFSLGATTYVLAEGGGSVANDVATGGLGGAAASGTGDTKYSGGVGAIGTDNHTGGGGGSSAGTGADGTAGSGTTGGVAPSGGGNGGAGGDRADGSAGSLPGGGGGGSSTRNGTQSGANGANGEVMYSYLVDVTPPTVSNVAVTPSAGGFTSGTPSITATLTESESFILGCEYTIDGGSTWTAGVVSGTSNPWTCTGTPGDPTPLAEGSSVMANVRATSAGGLSDPGIEVDLTVDATAPVVAISAPAVDTIVNGLATFTFSDNDGSAVNQCSVDNSSWVDCTTDTTTLSALSGFDALPEGAFTLYLQGTDLVGNIGSDSRNLIKDSLAPSITIGAPSLSSTLDTAGPVTFSVTYADTNFNASTLALGDISLNATGTASGTLGLSGSGTAYTVGITDITGVGTLGISIAANTASDLAGNLAPASGASTTFDIVPGALDHFAISTIVSPQAAGTAITGITLTAEDVDGNTVPDFTASVTYGGTAGITGSSAAFVAGQLSGVSVTPTVAGLNETFTVSSASITGTSNTFDVDPGPLDHFAISSISSPQTAGTAITGITLTAQDSNNNTLTGFTSSVTFGGTAGITGTSDPFVLGQLTVTSVTPTIAGLAETFTVTSASVTSTSNSFEVDAGALDHFAISAISSPQKAGVAITGITLTAQDSNNNTVTGFNSSVTYGGTAGITGTSGTFTLGQLAGVSVTPHVWGSAMTFTVSASGKTGSSSFDVLADYYIFMPLVEH